jgi:methyl-accepting chemotaxis protein III, ribose and galactose sensor receptor
MNIHRALVLLLCGGGLLGASSAAYLYVQSVRTEAVRVQLAGTQERLLKLRTTRQACDSLKVRVLSWTLTRRSAQKGLYEQARQACVGGLEALAKISPEGRDLLAKVGEYVKIMEDVQANMTEEGRNSATASFQRQAEPLGKAIDEAFDALDKVHARIGQEALADMAEDHRTALLSAWSLCVLALLFSGVILMLARYKVVLPLLRLKQAADRLAQGDLTQPCGGVARDEVGDLMRSLERMRQAWAGALGNLSSTSLEIASASQRISEGTRLIADSSDRQAAALQRTTSSMQDMHTAVAQSSENAIQASALAGETTQATERGGELVNDVVKAMGALQQASRRVAAITKIIDELAAQTNLLALNAAVEAARAGEHGRGFNVVAAEVRSLARRCAESASEIRVLVDESAAQVDAGMRLADGAGEAMRLVLGKISDMEGRVRAIATLSTTHQERIAVVHQSVGELGAVMSVNLKTVDQSSASVSSLNDQTRSLNELMSTFRLR